MNTSVYKYVRQIVQNLGYQFLISKILICPSRERIKKVWTVFSHAVRRDTLCLRQCDYQWYYIADTLFNVFLFFARFLLTNPWFSTNKFLLFRIPKGTPYSCNCLFKLRKIVDWQSKSWRAQLHFELSNVKNGQELIKSLHFERSSNKSGCTYATIAIKPSLSFP